MAFDRWGRRSLIAVIFFLLAVGVCTPFILAHQVNARVADVRARASEQRARLLAEEFIRPPAVFPSTTCDAGLELQKRLSELDYSEDFRTHAREYEDLIHAIARCDRSSGEHFDANGFRVIGHLIRYLSSLAPADCGEVAPVVLRLALDEPFQYTFAGNVLVATTRCIERGLDPEGLSESLAEVTAHRRPFATTAKLAILRNVLEETEWLHPFEVELSSTLWRRYEEHTAHVRELEEALEEEPVMRVSDDDAVAALHALLLVIDERLREDPRVRDVDGQPFEIEHGPRHTLVVGDTVNVRVTHRSGECELGLNQLIPPNGSGCDPIEIDVHH